MPKEALQGAADYLAKNSRRRIWKRVVGVLICIVVFCTTYALIVPAITMENHTVYCGFEEHQHTPECYEKKLLCGQEEGGSAVHTHTDECYGDDGTLKCGFEEGGETADHVHTEECYEDVLLCGKEEHSHVLLCHSDPTADVESPEDWSASVDGVKLTGSWRIDLLAVAESQLGYKESTRNYTVDGDGQTTKGYTRYGAWYGDSYGNWDAMFVSFCLNFAKVEGFPQESSVSRWAELLQKEEYGFYRAKENYAPRAGDLIFLDTDADRVADRVGLVAELSETAKGQTALRILEGDLENCVQYTEYSPSDEGVLGYGELPKEPQMEYCWSHGGMEIVASVRKSADLPENASLTVRPLSPEDTDSAYGEKYAASQEKIAAENPAEITRFDLFKVYLEADGQEVLPKEEATVEIRLSEKNASAADSTEIFRYSENGAEKVEAELNEASGA